MPAAQPPSNEVSYLNLSGHAWLLDLQQTFDNLVRLEGEDLTAPQPPATFKPVDDIVTGWIDFELEQLAAERASQPQAARALMLISVAMNDALLLADLARSQGMEVSDSTALAVAAQQVFASLHPEQSEQSPRADLFFQPIWGDYWQGKASFESVRDGIRVGYSAGFLIAAMAKHDHHAEAGQMSIAPAAQPGRWTAATAQAEEPGWGNVSVLTADVSPRPRSPAPPAWDSPEMETQREAFLAARRPLTDHERELVALWSEAPGATGAPALWMLAARQAIVAHNIGDREAAPIYAALGVALHDAAVLAWDNKYHYLVERPVGWMQQEQPAWAPLTSVPEHPAYPSATAVFSAAARYVLTAAFPEESPHFEQLAEEATRAGLLAGVDWPQDGPAGQELGWTVFNLMTMELMFSR